MNAKLFLSAGALVALSGCSLVQNNSTSVRSAQVVDMSGYFAQQAAEGRRYLDAKRPTRAIEAFRQASHDRSHAPQAFNGMGVAYVMLGREDIARRMFEKAIAANPDDERFARNLARLDLPAELNDEAQPLLAQLGQSNDAAPNESVEAVEVKSADLEEGRRLLDAARPVLAVEAFRRAAEDGSVVAQAYNGLGVAYSQLGQEDVAKQMFERAIALAPMDLRYARNLARLEGLPHAPLGQPVYALPENGDEQEIKVTLITVSGESLPQTAKEVHIEPSFSEVRREKKISTVSTAEVKPITINAGTPLGHNEESPNYWQSIKLFALARRQIGSSTQEFGKLDGEICLYLRPSMALSKSTYLRKSDPDEVYGDMGIRGFEPSSPMNLVKNIFGAKNL